MSNTLLNSASGHTATLGTLATVTELPGQSEIRRENLQRDVDGYRPPGRRDLGSAYQQRCSKLWTVCICLLSIRVVYGGTYEEQQKSFHDLMMVLMLATLLVFHGAFV